MVIQPRIQSLATLFAALLVLVVAGPASAQGLRIIEPAAGAEVPDAFEIRIGGEAGRFVRINVDSEEVASLKLGRDGLAQARVQAPERSPFTLSVEQLDGDEVVSLTSIRLRRAGQPDGTAAASPPPPTGEQKVDPAGDELPPPPPPPGDSDGSFEKETDVAAPPPVGPEPRDPVVRSEEKLSETTKIPKPVKPKTSTRLIRILITGTVGIFAVPTGWFAAVLGAGFVTNFDDDVLTDNNIAWIFLVSGVLSSTASTWISGASLKGNGSIWATLGGAALVGALSILSFEVDDGTGNQDFLAASLIGSFASIGGAMIGYEVTSDTDADFSAKTGIHDAMISGVPTPDGRGFTVGVGGRF